MKDCHVEVLPIILFVNLVSKCSRELAFKKIDEEKASAGLMKGFNKGLDSMETVLLKWLYDLMKGETYMLKEKISN